MPRPTLTNKNLFVQPHCNFQESLLISYFQECTYKRAKPSSFLWQTMVKQHGLTAQSLQIIQISNVLHKKKKHSNIEDYGIGTSTDRSALTLSAASVTSRLALIRETVRRTWNNGTVEVRGPGPACPSHDSDSRRLRRSVTVVGRPEAGPVGTERD